MTPRHHAHLASRLIKAGGGLDDPGLIEAAGKSRARLGDYQNPNEPDAIMPADVIFRLEEYCGQPIYSRALFEARPHIAMIKDLLTEALEDTEEAADLQRLARRVTEDGDVNAAERAELVRALDRRERQFGELKAAIMKVTA